jgi:hypothetical protein
MIAWPPTGTGSPRRRALTSAARGKDHPHAIRILARAWIYVIWRCWHDGTAYDPAKHNALQRVLGQQHQAGQAAAPGAPGKPGDRRDHYGVARRRRRITTRPEPRPYPATQVHTGQLATSIRVTRWLAGIGFPAVEPLPVEQPVTGNGCAVTFWRYMPQDGP